MEMLREITWTSHPVARNRVKGAVVVLLIVGLAVLAGVWMGNPYWGIFAFLVLFLSLESYFFATTYRLGEDGVEVRKRFSKSFRGWDTFRTIYVDRRGVTLSPYGGRSLMEPFRALRLLFENNRQAVLEYVKDHVGPDARFVESL
jgi:hypothetical protein